MTARAAGRGRESRPHLRRLEAVAQPPDRRPAAPAAAGGGRRELHHRPARDLRAGRRIRLRQIDGRQDDRSASWRRPPASVVIDGVSMTDPKQEAGRRQLRRRIQMVFQDPYASLNPRWRARDIVAEPLRAFGLRHREPATSAPRSTSCLRLVGLDPADGAKYPHEFSGGQRQRIAIARALAARPDFIVCDEPTSALDVSVQAQILNLMRDLQDRFGLTYLFISHNLAVVRHMANRIGVHVSRAPGRGGGRQGACSARRGIPTRACCSTRCPTSTRAGARASRSRARSPTRSIRRRAAPSIRAAATPTRAAAPSSRS